MGCCSDCGCEDKVEKGQQERNADSPSGAKTILKTDSVWRISDRLGRFKVRLGFGRDGYRVKPGLYALGNPDRSSHIIVTANYKLSFDIVRKSLRGHSVYILVLDTKGINVWCAAGKGSFGTDELLRRVLETDLDVITDTRELILPQLGAPGVSAHKVKQLTGFKVTYGPVRAEDLPDFIDSGKKKTGKMGLVSFNFGERFEIAPLEFVQGLKYFLPIFAALLVLSFIGPLGTLAGQFRKDVYYLLAAYLTGTLGVPLLLPILPGKPFAVKGAALGLVILVVVGLAMKVTAGSLAVSLAVFLPVSAFSAMNFTGATPFTNITGVEREIKKSVPVLIALSAAGIVFKGLLYGGVI
jgi:hypothetical protein